MMQPNVVCSLCNPFGTGPDRPAPPGGEKLPDGRAICLRCWHNLPAIPPPAPVPVRLAPPVTPVTTVAVRPTHMSVTIDEFTSPTVSPRHEEEEQDAAQPPAAHPPPPAPVALKKSCTVFVAIQIKQIQHPNGSFDRLRGLLDIPHQNPEIPNVDVVGLLTPDHAKNPNPFLPWAVDKAVYLHHEHLKQRDGKIKVQKFNQICGRTLILRALLSEYPEGPTARLDTTYKRYDEYHRCARCNYAQYFWHDDYVDFLLENSTDGAWMAGHVEGMAVNQDVGSKEYLKGVDIRKRVSDNGVDFHYVACSRVVT